MSRFVIFSLKISDAVIIWQLSDKTDLEWIISKVVILVGLEVITHKEADEKCMPLQF